MCRKPIYLISLVLVLGLFGNASADLVAYWPLDADAKDIVGGHDGTLAGGAQFTNDPERSSVLSVNGVDGRVEIPHSDALVFGPSDSFSIAAWLNIRTLPGNWAGVVTKSRDIEPWYGLWITPGNQWHFVGGEGGANTRMDVGAAATGWLHFAGVYDADAQTQTVYVDGAVIAENTNVTIVASGAGDVWFGGAKSVTEFLDALIDDVRIYDHALSEIEILGAMEGEPWPYAWGPSPADGAVYPDTWVSLGWKAGDFAVSHNVYMGTNFADVDSGTGGTFLASVPENNMMDPYLIVGIIGYPLPEGLVPGTTYYWRVDEVNDANVDSPWKGNVWSFSIPPRKAYEPVPDEGARFVNTDVTLTWTPGFGANLHIVYFGDDFDTVNNATGGTGQPLTTYTPPGPLEMDKTYYWRVDESDFITTYTGDVWSFKTLPVIPITDPNLVGWWKLDEGSGTTALDWSGHGNHGTLQDDPQWVPGFDGDALELDGAGDYVQTPPLGINSNTVTMTAWVKRDGDQTGWAGVVFHRTGGRACGIGFSGQAGMTNHLQYHWNDNDGATYNFASGLVVPDNEWAFVAVVVEPSRATLYLNGTTNFAVNSITHITQQLSGPLLLGVDTYNMSRVVRGAIDDARVYDKALTAEEIREAMRGDPTLAWEPNPANGATPNVDEALPLTWSPGDNAAQHDVYFGLDKDAVEDADTSTPDIYRRRQGATSYTPPEGVEWGGGPYYWRIDEYNTDATLSKGRVWSFTVADFVGIDDIESYDVDNQIWWTWHDGLGYVHPDTGEFIPGDGSGSEVGDPDTPSTTEEGIFHGGGKSMPVWWNNTGSTGKFLYSETTLTLTGTRDWTEEGVKALSLWFQGRPGSVGSFVQSPPSTYTMTASGTDIWDVGTAGDYHDEFHFAYKMLNGQGTIIARVESVEDTDGWAKAGVMIRETLEGGSPHGFVCVTPDNGVAAQGRPTAGAASFNVAQGGITAPHWVRLERDLAGNFTASHSTDGSSWEAVTGATPQNIQMSSNVYVGLALTAHNAALTCEGVFSNVTITGNVSGQWMSQDIGIESNNPEPMYVAIANSTGPPAVVYHDDPSAAQMDTWTEWNIDLKEFQDQGVNLTDVDKIFLGFGDRSNPQLGGAGKMYFDDLRLYRSRCIPDKVTLSAADLNSDCVVDYRDLEMMAGDWLAGDPGLAGDLNVDDTVDFKDYAVLADQWLEEQLWPE